MRVARLFLFADWPEKYFSGQSEGGISNASGTRSVRVSAQGLSRSCCKLSPMKIPSSRLAAPGSPRMLLPIPLPVFFFFYFTTVICWHFPAINYFYIYLPINIIKIQRNLHLNYFYYKDTSLFRVTARKNDLFLSIHWFSVEQKGHAFHSSARSSLRRHLPWNEGLLPCSGRAQW